MTDLEGTTRTLIDKKWSKERIISKLVEEYLVYKELTKDQKFQLFEEIYNSVDQFHEFILSYNSGTKKKFTEMA